MIHVDRTQVPVPEILTAEDDHKNRGGKRSAAKEKRKARESLNKWRSGDKKKAWSFKFSIYSDDSVREALHELFQGKCAYCESRYSATQPMDVEHFRPKGRVDWDGDNPPDTGYWWLAADWNNLLPSCIDCNRKRWQIDAITEKEVLVGKQDSFPLRADAKPAAAENRHLSEDPLLLDPGHDHPEKFIEFVVDDASVRPRGSSTQPDIERAEASIRVYGLNRAELVLMRREAIRLIQRRLQIIEGLGRLLAEHGHELHHKVVLVLEEIIQHEILELKACQDARRPYAQLARQVIGAHRSRFDAIEPGSGTDP